ncbi:GumC family protein [Calothrix sp. PCC 7507]|uniref:GumC family protein n=1 Tax=Calothrix sp. PCC 7507 TaxID=99598 RepID=UPI00029F41CD|nr:polysaccharide biosynthesis tyrosine autokinase [Calothrix sp. PCC 7507]AFY35657.1 capsular exopolysaccharide family [Calothrix sp. PCC 7507]
MQTKGYSEEKGYPEEIDVQKYWLVVKRRWVVASGVFVTSVVCTGLAVSLQRPAYQATGQVLVQSSKTSSLTGVGQKIGDLESLKREGNPLDTQAVVLQSLPIRQQVISTLKLKGADGKLLDPNALAIKVEPIVGTDVLKISYTTEQPQLAAAVVNQLMKAYIANNIFTNRAEALAAGEFVAKELPRAKLELDRTAETLRRFKTQNQIIELEEEASAAVETITDLNDQINRAKSDLADVGAQELAIRSQVNLEADKAVEVTSLNQTPGVQEVLTELQKVQTKLAAQQGLYTAEHPAIVYLKNQEIALNDLLQQRTAQVVGSNVKIAPGNLQIGELRQKLAADFLALQAKRLGIQRKIDALLNQQKAYKQRADILPFLEKRQGELQRSLLVAQKNYETLITRLQEIRVAENQTVGNARVIQPAVAPKQPAATKQLLFLAGGGLVGALLSIAAAFFVDLIDRRLKTVKEAEALFGYTLLGLIPKFETNHLLESPASDKISPRVIVAKSPRSVIHEAYQMLQANLKFISLDRKARTIVVTSSVSGEGKSEVTANLATVMAQAGRRVLLVDADMRQPSQHHLWGLINSVGFSNVIAGENEFSEAVQSVTNNLSVLTAGVMPPNPLALIDSERMTSLMEMFAQRYDYVVFDTPSLVGTADAAVLGKMAGGVLVVVRPGLVDSGSATAAKSLLARSEANILGIVANGVNVKYEPDNYFYYSNSRSEVRADSVGRQRATVSSK